jgi:hypothetical protein
MRRPAVTPRPEQAPARHVPPAVDVDFGEPRPSFAGARAANDAEAERRSFNLFGWMRPSAPPTDDSASYREPVADEELPPRRDPPAVEPPRDSSLDEELEIPAFLRRQMNPR